MKMFEQPQKNEKENNKGSNLPRYKISRVPDFLWDCFAKIGFEKVLFVILNQYFMVCQA